jgi:hypothetical protein
VPISTDLPRVEIAQPELFAAKGVDGEFGHIWDTDSDFVENLQVPCFVQLIHDFQRVFEWHAPVGRVQVEDAYLLAAQRIERLVERFPELCGGKVTGR